MPCAVLSISLRDFAAARYPIPNILTSTPENAHLWRREARAASMPLACRPACDPSDGGAFQPRYGGSGNVQIRRDGAVRPFRSAYP
ncbi:hypothetical protein A8H31_08465 [Burkholderia thailandensis]|nr:hypothetical protein A8H31_08465 [Burkholderia thailandensis]AVR29377.1 hypothetical protein A8H32_32280 [Burkholderia thailandensis]NOK44077.1 hypothetical protein [Burkholderia thailandensis]NOK55043.1 hypothetical protein [Burkholderia thailandensis]PJO69253.1 hypothetical protein CWD92_27825 [Burkholderia thailandensis]